MKSLEMTNSPSALGHISDPDLVRKSSFIRGEWSATGPKFDVTNPTTGKVIACVSGSNVSDAKSAILAAQAALEEWRKLHAKVRSHLLRVWFGLIEQHAEDLARILSAEQGKPLREARSEVAYGASFVEWYAEESKRLNGELLPAFETGRQLMALRQPIGVCAAITPWNFPIAMITRKVAPALAAGCTVIVKPAEQTPLCALALGELARRAGIPAGVFNVLAADGPSSVAIGRELCESPIVRHLSFTGSTAVGKLLMAQCAPTVKKLALELGGNAPFIVFDDADLPSAVAGAIASKFRNAGQTCVCANRIYVQTGLHDAFLSLLVQEVDKLKMGNPFEAETTIGPLIDADSALKVQRFVDDAVSQGATVVTGGTPQAGTFYPPTVLQNVNERMLCMREETFGPLAPICRFDTEEEVIQLANAGDSGLAAYVYTKDIARIFKIAEMLECGMLGVNASLISSEHVPFGGVKQSGLGREGGRVGLDEYTEIKYVCLGGL